MAEADIQLTRADEDALKRAQKVLDDAGVRVDIDTLRKAFVAAETPPEPEIKVSPGMIAVGRKIWLNNPSGPVHVLLSMFYRAMEQQRRDEER